MKMKRVWLALCSVVVISLGYCENALAQPSTPTGFVARAGNERVILYWNPNPELDIWYYRIYIGISPQGPFSWNSSAIHPQTTFTKAGLINGVTYYFRLSAVNTAGQESSLTNPVSATPQAPKANYDLIAIPNKGKVHLQWDSVPEALQFFIYMSTHPFGSYTLIANLPWNELSYTINNLANHHRYYFRLYAAFDAITSENHKRLIGEASAVPSDRLGFAETMSFYIVQYYVNGKPVRYYFNKLTAEDTEGIYSQFAPHISFDNVPVTATPYLGGRAGLILMTLANRGDLTDTPQFSGVIERLVPGQIVVLRYTSVESRNEVPAGDASIWMTFEANKPYLQIRVWAKPSTLLQDFRSSWNVFSAIGGQYNARSRLVIPYDEDNYYVINGQAVGIHYFPRKDTWILRMGAQGTPYEHITTGFFFARPEDAPLLANAGWAMGHDYCSNLDSVPYGLDQISDELYINYLEDEAGDCKGNGLGYSWQNADTAYRSASPDTPYESEIYYWVGEDHWSGEYGMNQESQYRFAIDIWQDVAAAQAIAVPIPLPTSLKVIYVTAILDPRRFTVTVHDRDSDSLRLEVFDLGGRQIFDSKFIKGQQADWNLLASSGQLIANGVYLYVITVRKRYEDIYLYHSVINKLVILR